MKVMSIPKEQTHEWLLHKHYAKRVPGVVTHSFGLYDDGGGIQGVCVLGLGNREFNNGKAIFNGHLVIPTYELQRLVVNEGLPKNTLSYFVGGVIKLLPKPTCLYSYADSNMGHHGYIYQATNWIYTGMSKPRTTFFDTLKGEFVHERTLSGIYGTSARDSLPKHIEIGVEEGGKHRYFMFIGSRKDVKEMRRYLSFKVLPYPKGENKRYDASYVPKATMRSLFA